MQYSSTSAYGPFVLGQSDDDMEDDDEMIVDDDLFVDPHEQYDADVVEHMCSSCRSATIKTLLHAFQLLLEC